MKVAFVDSPQQEHGVQPVLQATVTADRSLLR
jgi:hypothetical protein